jgi:restriction system protein
MKTAKSYYRVMLGRKSIHAAACFAGNFIGADFGIDQDLTKKLPEEWRAFNKQFIPIYLSKRPDKSKITASLACEALRNSTGSIATVSEVSGYSEEIEKLIGGASAPKLISTDETVENPSAFAMEEHLEDFLVTNWPQTELGRDYDIFEDEDEKGQQYQTDTGPLDILAISKDKRRLLVVELKKGRASDVVVWQTLRYTSFVQEELAEKDEVVEGAIIALEDDQRIRRALAMVPNIRFFRYQVDFKLIGP